MDLKNIIEVLNKCCCITLNIGKKDSKLKTVLNINVY